MNKFLLVLMLTLSANSYAVTFTAIPCNTSNGLITNVGPHPDDNSLCDFQAAEVKLKVYSIALCTQAPIFSDSSSPDLSSCSFVYNNDSYNEISLSSSSGFNLTDLSRPANGTYPYFLIVMSNTLKVKATAHFNSSRTSQNGGSGEFCWTDGSSITPVSPLSANGILNSGNGMSCGSALGGNYDFNEIIWQGPWVTWQGTSEVVPGGINTDYFLNSSLVGVTSLAQTSKWASVHQPTSPVIVDQTTTALRMSINLSSGASLKFDTGILKWIEDAPFGYLVSTVSQ